MNGGRRLFVISWAMCLLFVAAASAARAGSDDERSKHPIDRAAAACHDQAGTTAESLECYDKDLKLWERELNRVYRALHAKLTPSEQRALEKAQRAWLQYRDSECALQEEYYSHFIGTIWVQVLASIRPELTRTRALDLQAMLHVVDDRPSQGN